MMKLLLVALVAAAVTACCSTVALATSYNISFAKTAVEFAKIAYCQSSSIEAWAPRGGDGDPFKYAPGVVNVTFTHDRKTLFGVGCASYVSYDKQRNMIVVGLRGTVDLEGWLVDFDFFQVDPGYAGCVNCKVHGGLFSAWRRMSEVIVPAVLILGRAHPEATVLVTGHSMGATQSLFAMTDIVLNLTATGFKGKYALYNFANARVVDDNWSVWFNQVIIPQLDASYGAYMNTNSGDPIYHIAPIFFNSLNLGSWIHPIVNQVFHADFPYYAQDYSLCRGTPAKEGACGNDNVTNIFEWGMKAHVCQLGVGMGCVSDMACPDYMASRPELNKPVDWASIFDKLKVRARAQLAK
jgi:hypothetical protein